MVAGGWLGTGALAWGVAGAFEVLAYGDEYGLG